MIEIDQCRVLVVDDHRPSAAMLVRALEVNGYPTRAAYNSAGAFEQIRDFDPVAVILDLAIPHVGGEVIASTLRAQGDRRLFVALSGIRGGPGLVRHDAFDYFFRKPLRAEILVDVIELRRLALRAPD